jgi:hypothetical protein
MSEAFRGLTTRIGDELNLKVDDSSGLQCRKTKNHKGRIHNSRPDKIVIGTPLLETSSTESAQLHTDGLG